MHNHLLFAENVLAHWIAAMSGIVSFTLGIVEYFREQKTEATIFCVVACLFLIVSFDQAWQDEHTNNAVLTAEKVALWGERNFWKQQSYEKDARVSSRDQIIEKSSSALIAEQTAANQTQKSLSQLAGKILDIDKSVSLKITPHFLGLVGSQYNPNIKGKYHGTFLVLTNITVTPIRLLVSCESSILEANASVLGTGAMMSGGWGGRVTSSDMNYGVGILSPAWTTANPLLVTIYTDHENIGHCKFDEK